MLNYIIFSRLQFYFLVINSLGYSFIVSHVVYHLELSDFFHDFIILLVKFPSTGEFGLMC